MLQVAVIGLGNWGPNLVRCLQSLNSCDLVALCDNNKARLKEVERTCPTMPLLTHWKDLLSNSNDEALLIATPADLHFEMALAGLQSGKHVFVEKPLACRTDQAERLSQESIGRGLVLMVDNTYLFEPAVTLIKDLLRGGQLGEPLHYKSRRLNMYGKRNDTNVLWDLAWHDLAILDFLFSANWLKTSVERSGQSAISLTLEAAAGSGAPSVEIEVDWTATSKQRWIEIECRAGKIIYNDLDPAQKVAVCVAGHTSFPTTAAIEPLASALSHFVDCVVSGRMPIADSLMGLRITKVLEAANTYPFATGPCL